jgi:hypothetical protein
MLAEVMEARLEVKTVREFHAGFVANAFERQLCCQVRDGSSIVCGQKRSGGREAWPVPLPLGIGSKDAGQVRTHGDQPRLMELRFAHRQDRVIQVHIPMLQANRFPDAEAGPVLEDGSTF